MKLLLTTLSVCVLLTVSAQDAMLVDAKQSFILTNPSFAGSNGSVRGQFVGRTQWPNLSGRSLTSYNSVDAYVKQLHGGVAISALHNDQSFGALKSTQINVIYAPVFDLSETQLKIIPSIQLGYIQAKGDANFFYRNDGFGWGMGAGPSGTMIKKSEFDLSAGLLLNYKHFYAGASAFHINEPELGLYGVSALPMRLSLNASYNVSFGEKNLLNVSAVYNSQMHYGFTTLSANLILMNRAVLGLGLVTNDLVFLNAGYRNQYFSLVAGIDLTVSRLAGSHAGSYQLALGVRIPKKNQTALLQSFEAW